MGLFGESTEELARREIEAKKNYSAKHGVEVNANIDDLKLVDNIITQDNIIRNRYNYNRKIILITTYVFAILFTAIIIISAVNYVIKPKSNYEGFNKAVNAYLSQIGNVKSYDISPNANDIYYVTIKGNTWKGKELDKVSYCDAIRKTFTAYAWDYHIIDKNNTIYVMFENEDGITLAEPDGIGFGKYKIYY